MSYAIYNTSGFILGSAPLGEANKVYSIYTQDFGLIRASAQGVRYLRSKLRYNLEDFSYISFSLVKGREVWRITGAVLISDNAESDSGIKAMRARVLTLVRRLVQGEERNDPLFDSLKSLFIDHCNDQGSNDDLETVSLMRILSSLGYLDIAATENLPKREMIHAINKALKETHL